MSTPVRIDPAFLSRRRAAVTSHLEQTGLDYITVESVPGRGKYKLNLHFLPARLGEKAIPEGITTESFYITGGAADARANVRVDEILKSSPAKNILSVHLQTEESAVAGGGDFPTYTLHLVNVPNLDPFFSQATFSLDVDEPSEFDCQPSLRATVEKLPSPEIDYLARDLAGFRKLLLDRLSVVLPRWRERNPADLGIALVEVLAYAADQVSYYQDAVATEAYLGTARRRVSVRRHARLLDYAMHEGCNARAWVQVQVDGSSLLAQGTQLFTRVAGQPPHVPPNSSIYDQALAQGPKVFETMHPAELCKEHDEIPFYAWGADEFSLPKGATRATLRDGLGDGVNRLHRLQAGAVLVFEEVKGPGTGKRADADPVHRHAVRLTRVTFSEDPLGQFLEPSSGDTVLIAEIEWHAQDALPFPLCISTLSDGRRIENVSVARGNVVLADHGRTIAGEELLPPTAPAYGHYRPRLRRTGITHGAPHDRDLARTQSATAATIQDAREALPQVSLGEGGEVWVARRDLLGSDRFARHFVVEMEGGEQAHLRFSDGVHGRQPSAGSTLKATYRLGNGLQGNVGCDAIAHIVTADSNIAGVRNPLPAQGGVDPESIEQVRLYAPQAFRTQERCVTAADYAAIARRHPEVVGAAAALRWTGAWHTMFVAVERAGNRPVDDAFKAKLRDFLEHFRLTGCDVEVQEPRFVPLDIALTVHVAPGHRPANVRQALLETFSDVDLPDGRRGFFHADNFSFGQPVYLSQIVARTMEVPGVVRVDTDDTFPKRNRFKCWGQPPRGEREAGEIAVGPLEIARLDNDPDAPENGRIEFYLEVSGET